MNVQSLQWPKDQPLTSPFPLRNGIFVALRSGDLYSPDSWQNTKHYTRQTNARWRPYFSARYGRFGFYVGWKTWGCDTEKQVNAPGILPEEVYKGSVAMQGCTARFSGKVQ